MSFSTKMNKEFVNLNLLKESDCDENKNFNCATKKIECIFQSKDIMSL